mmetsp:Transcript_70910/g.169823  ORF Transcript_70910/g.169823 Transcript_70910/m.169823 type:complete len:317 (+) Transcript_70910:294-1244(+)
MTNAASPPAVRVPRCTSIPPELTRPRITPFPAKSKTIWLMPRVRAAEEAAAAQAAHLTRNFSASMEALSNQRTTSECCRRSSAKPHASSRALATFFADLPALLTLALLPFTAPTIRSGHTTYVSCRDALNITKLPPTTENVYLARFCSFGTISAHKPTSASSPAAESAASPVEASAPPLAGDADAAEDWSSTAGASFSLGSSSSLARNTSKAKEARSFSVVESTTTVLMHPATAPMPNITKLLPTKAATPLPLVVEISSKAFLTCVPVRKFTNEATVNAPTPSTSLGASGRRWEKSHTVASSIMMSEAARPRPSAG